MYKFLMCMYTFLICTYKLNVYYKNVMIRVCAQKYSYLIKFIEFYTTKNFILKKFDLKSTLFYK
jgi:hypothetical protein